MSDPKPAGPNIFQQLAKAGSVLIDTTVKTVEEANKWRSWAIRALNRIDLQDATAEELQRAIEEKLR